MSGFQLSGDAPTIYNRVGLKLLEPWTEDLIVCGKVRDGDRVLDLACGTAPQRRGGLCRKERS